MADAGCNKQVVGLGLHGIDRLQQHARAVLERPAKAPRAVVSAQQLAEQVTVTRLHIHAVETGLLAQVRCVRKCLNRAVEVLVGHHGIVFGQGHACIVMRIVRGDNRFLLARWRGEAPGMRELGDDGNLGAIGFQLVDEGLVGIHVAIGNPQRVLVRAALFLRGQRFQPD